MRRDDWTLLAISAAQAHGLSPVQLQKALFLLGRNLSRAEIGAPFYDFAPYNYGPFDADVYRDAEALEQSGFVNISQTPERRWPLYEVTSFGAEAAARLRRDVPARALAYLDTVVKWVARLSFRDLVSAIYAEYPEYRANSVFKD